MMFVRDDNRERLRAIHLTQIPRSLFGVALHHRPLRSFELARFVEHFQRHHQLADVMKQRGHAERVKHSALNAKRSRLRQDEKRNIHGVHERVFVMLFQLRQRQHRSRRLRQ